MKMSGGVSPCRLKAVSKYNKSKKKLHRTVVACLNHHEDCIAENPRCGQKKSGDLKDVYVYKFHFLGLEYLIAYLFDEEHRVVTLLSVGLHENFYRSLKRYF